MSQKLFFLVLIVFFFERYYSYQIGVGISDITGPTGIGFYGYAIDKQIGNGILFRLFSRAYIIEEEKKRIVFVNADLWSGQESIKSGVIKELKKIYGDLYTFENLCFSSIHQHSGPGGYSFGALYNIANFGVVKSVVQAHNNMKKGKIFYNEGKLHHANINRSPGSYFKNPESERRKYKDGNTDKTMRILKFVDIQNKPLGVIAWFSVHAASLPSSNKLISGDNKGFASYLFERKVNSEIYENYQPGNNSFIASFPEAPSGDSSANTGGAFCPNGDECEYHSDCEGKAYNCLGRGPTNDTMKNMKIIGGKQFEKAYELFNSASLEVKGSIDFVHNFVEMSKVKIKNEYLKNSTNEKLCLPAFGPGFFAGTTDGVSGLNVAQGIQEVPEYLNLFGKFVSEPSNDQVQCQLPKTTILNLDLSEPYPWIPKYTPVQLLKIGQIFIFAVSTELTTMSARRLTKNLKKSLIEKKLIGKEAKVILTTVANGYTHYTTTPEEFTKFRYEGASTLFGNYQLNAFHQELDNLIQFMVENKKPKVESYQIQKETENLKIFSTHTGFQKFTDSFDSVVHKFIYKFLPKKSKAERKFGSLKLSPKVKYQFGEIVKIQFVGNHLRIGFQKFDTLMTVEKKNKNQKWDVIKTDAHIETKIYEESLNGCYLITLEWEITSDITPGIYRVTYFGMDEKIKTFVNSPEFEVQK
eukprot:gene5587-9403_t